MATLPVSLSAKYLSLSTTIDDRTCGPDGNGCLRDRLASLARSLEYVSQHLAADVSECLAYANCTPKPAELRQMIIDDMRSVLSTAEWSRIRDRFRYAEWLAILPTPISLPFAPAVATS